MKTFSMSLRPCRSENKNIFRSGVTKSLWRWIPIATMALLGLMFSWPASSEGNPYQEAEEMDSAKIYFTGIVTDKYTEGLEVNNQNYHLHQEVVIKDEMGGTRRWNQVAKGSHVKIHLYRGKIDEIIQILPK